MRRKCIMCPPRMDTSSQCIAYAIRVPSPFCCSTDSLIARRGTLWWGPMWVWVSLSTMLSWAMLEMINGCILCPLQPTYWPTMTMTSGWAMHVAIATRETTLHSIRMHPSSGTLVGMRSACTICPQWSITYWKRPDIRNCSTLVTHRVALPSLSCVPCDPHTTRRCFPCTPWLQLSMPRRPKIIPTYAPSVCTSMWVEEIETSK